MVEPRYFKCSCCGKIASQFDDWYFTCDMRGYEILDDLWCLDCFLSTHKSTPINKQSHSEFEVDVSQVPEKIQKQTKEYIAHLYKFVLGIDIGGFGFL